MREGPLKMINFLTGFLLLSGLHCTLTAVVTGTDGLTFLHSLIYLPVVIFLSIAAKKCRKSWQYLLSSALILCITYYVGEGGFEKILTMLLITAAVLSYFTARSKNIACWLEEPSYPFLGVFLGMYLLQLRFPSELVEKYAVIGVGIYYLLCIWQTNISQMQKILSADAKLERFPAKRLRQSNFLMLGIQTVIVTIGMCIAPFAGIDGVIYKLGDLLRNAIAWLLRGLESEEVVSTTKEAARQAGLEAVEAAETPWFIELLSELFGILSWLIVIGFTAYVIYRILKFLYQLYLDFDMRSAENGDQIEQIYVAETDEAKRMRKQKRENLFWDRSPNARIRKYYKRRVLKDSQEAPKSYMTPEEIEKGVVMGEEEKRNFHVYYEKARYGKEGCTKEEAAGYRF